jgi:FAD/FMN-containing dehydrogenase
MFLNATAPSFIDQLAKHLPPETLTPAEPRHLEEPRGKWRGISQWVARPRRVEEVAHIVKSCGAARVGLIPLGGGTGLVAGQVMPQGTPPLLLSLERMNKVRAAYPEENVLIAEAGCVLAQVQSASEEINRLFPLSLASEGSAQIGGLLSTNAGGVNVLRYGNARDQVLGLEAVLPDGQIWHGLKRLRKDNTGYDLRHLLMGAEGTLGVITAASLKLSPRPSKTGTALFVVPSPAAALSLLSMARDQLGDGISAFELLHRTGYEFLSEVLPEVRLPWGNAPEWSILTDLSLPQAQNPTEALETLFERAYAAGLVRDGLVAQSEVQAQEFWTVREHFPEANRRIGSISSHDISIPLSLIPDFISEARAKLAEFGDWRINCFGHLGDGNLHFNVFPPKGHNRSEFAAMSNTIKACVHDIVHHFEGSISAEHGIGRLKADDLERYGDPVKLAAMRAIKSALDPHGIMNPGAVLRLTS